VVITYNNILKVTAESDCEILTNAFDKINYNITQYVTQTISLDISKSCCDSKLENYIKCENVAGQKHITAM